MSNNTQIYLTEHDHYRLTNLLDAATASTDPRLRTSLARLHTNLKSATIVPPEQIPADVVTLNSRIQLLDLDSYDDEVWLLCLPQDANISDERISVLSPVGTALLGSRIGQTVRWQSNACSGRLRVVDLLFQPEAAGVATL